RNRAGAEEPGAVADICDDPPGRRARLLGYRRQANPDRRGEPGPAYQADRQHEDRSWRRRSPCSLPLLSSHGCPSLARPRADRRPRTVRLESSIVEHGILDPEWADQGLAWASIQSISSGLL